MEVTYRGFELNFGQLLPRQIEEIKYLEARTGKELAVDEGEIRYGVIFFVFGQGRHIDVAIGLDFNLFGVDFLRNAERQPLYFSMQRFCSLIAFALHINPSNKNMFVDLSQAVRSNKRNLQSFDKFHLIPLHLVAIDNPISIEQHNHRLLLNKGYFGGFNFADMFEQLHRSVVVQEEEIVLPRYYYPRFLYAEIYYWGVAGQLEQFG